LCPFLPLRLQKYKILAEFCNFAPMNTIGHLFRLTTFGESHGTAIGGVIDGCPSQLKLDFDFIESELQRRKTAQSATASQRKEPDKIEWLSGLLDGVTLGTPIAFMVRNEDCEPEDYEAIKDIYRPSHADFAYEQKYGLRDWRGGGRASARTTLPIVVAGAIAKQILRGQGIQVLAKVTEMGDAEQARKEGDTVGGIVECRITGVPAGLGEPMFGKFSAELAHAMFSLPAVKGFEIGDGFASAKMKGSEANDTFINKDGGRRTGDVGRGSENNGITTINKDRGSRTGEVGRGVEDFGITTATNHSGGIQGGITNGNDIVFRVAFKPIPSIAQPQQTVNRAGETCTVAIEGRHDVCALPRAVVLVEALAAMVTLDMGMRAGR
jgi:chorismate synthase